MGTDQNKGSAPVIMDAKTLLRTINNGAQAKIHFFENLVRKLGERSGRPFRLTALNQSSLVFEDKSDNTHYLADITKVGGSVSRVEIENIRPIVVKEEKKSADFDKNVASLVDAISEDNNNEAEKYFKLIERQRFRSTVIPESGVVTTRDGVTHKIKLQPEVLDEGTFDRIRRVFVEAVSDKVEISEGRVVRGVFVESDQEFIIPITDMTRRRMVARMMKEAAEDAYKSPTFCKFVGEVAGLVSEARLEDAVAIAKAFLEEQQEFCLLTLNETRQLVENALAVNCNFSNELSRDVSKVLYRTNLRVNKDAILESWTLAAQKAQEPAILSELKDLGGSKTFMEDYEKFLYGVFNESSDIRSTRARAYLTSLKLIQSVLSRIEGEEAQADALGQMIQALEGGDVDDDALQQAEALLAGVSDSIVNSTRNIENFDQANLGDLDLSEPGAEEEEGDLLPIPDMGGIEGFDDGMMGMEPGMDMGAEAPATAGAPSPFESVEADDAISEGFTPIEKMSPKDLLEELESWKTHGHIYLREDGFDDIKDQFNRYIKRCMSLGDQGSGLLEAFEGIRDNLIKYGDVVNEADEVDPYAGSFASRFDVAINDTYSSFSESAKDAMEAAKGKGVAQKGTQQTDGKSGMSKAGKGGPASSSGGMDELQGKGGLAKKGVSKTPDLPKQPVELKNVGKKHSQDGKGVAESVAMDTGMQGGGGLVNKGTKNVDGRKGESAAGAGAAAEGGGKPAINKAKGSGVASKSVQTSDGRKAGGTAASGGHAPDNGDPDDGVTSDISAPRGENVSKYVTKGGGVAEGACADCHDCGPDCSNCDCDCHDSQVDEAQYKWGTKRQGTTKDGGKKKAKLANEGVHVTIQGEDPETGRSVTYEVSDDNVTADAMISAIAAELEGELGAGADMFGAEAPMPEEPMEPLGDMGDMGGDDMEPMGDMGDEPDMPGEELPGDELGDEESGEELPGADLDMPGDEGDEPTDEAPPFGGEGDDEGEEALPGDEDSITSDDLPPIDDEFGSGLDGAFGDEGEEEDSEESDDEGESENPFGGESEESDEDESDESESEESDDSDSDDDSESESDDEEDKD